MDEYHCKQCGYSIGYHNPHCLLNQENNMENLIGKLNIIYKGGMVKRYHNRPVLHTQNNAEHQYMVASIACLLYPEISAQQLKNFLWHDIYEYETGDMPWAIKRANPDIKAAINRIEEISIKKYQLTTKNNEFEHNLLKLAEYFECMVFCIAERNLGNKEFNKSIQDCIDCIEVINEFMKKENWNVYQKSLELLQHLGG